MLSGLPLVGQRQDIELTQRDCDLLAAIEPLMRKLHLNFYCVRCSGAQSLGRVWTNNHPSDQTWVVECACSHRVHHRAPAGSA